MAYAARLDNSRRFTTIAGVAAIHGLIGYVFISGMATSFVASVSKPFVTTNIPIDTPPPPDRIPPKLEKVTPQQPTEEVPPIAPLTHSVATPTDQVRIIEYTLPSFPLTGAGEAVTVTPPPPPVTVSKASGVAAIGNRGGWITTDDYPASALRAEEEGVVGITMRVGADGRVTSCAVTAPSGHASLDQATCRLYQRRARFAPARDDGGTPVAGTFTDRVRWVLPL